MLETHRGHLGGGSNMRVNDLKSNEPGFDSPDSYIYNNEISDHINGVSNNADVSYLKQMASKVKNGGNFILAACIGVGPDARKFAKNMNILTGSRVNIIFPKDFVNPGAKRGGPWDGVRSVNRILKVDNDAGWFSVSPSGNITNAKEVTLSRSVLPPTLIK